MGCLPEVALWEWRLRNDRKVTVERRNRDTLATLWLWASVVLPGRGPCGDTGDLLSWLLLWTPYRRDEFVDNMWWHFWDRHRIHILGPAGQAVCWESPLPLLNPTPYASPLTTALSGREAGCAGASGPSLAPPPGSPHDHSSLCKHRKTQCGVRKPCPCLHSPSSLTVLRKVAHCLSASISSTLKWDTMRIKGHESFANVKCHPNLSDWEQPPSHRMPTCWMWTW